MVDCPLKILRLTQVILSDGKLSTLMNMKRNLEYNSLNIGTAGPGRVIEGLNMVSACQDEWNVLSF